MLKCLHRSTLNYKTSHIFQTICKIIKNPEYQSPGDFFGGKINVG